GTALVRKDFAIMEAARRDPAVKNATHHPADALGWCRGALGIAMAALGTRAPVIDLFDAAWFAGVAQDMARTRPSRPLCLCHGALGWLEFLSFADRRCLGDDHMKEFEAWRNALFSETVGGRWVAVLVSEVQNLSLML